MLAVVERSWKCYKGSARKRAQARKLVRKESHFQGGFTWLVHDANGGVGEGPLSAALSRCTAGQVRPVGAYIPWNIKKN